MKQYEKDRKAFRQCAEEEKAGLFAKAADGDVQAKHRLAEHYMNWVLEIAEDYAHRGMMIQDLIQGRKYRIADRTGHIGTYGRRTDF